MAGNRGGAGSARQFLVHPEGRKLVVLGENLARRDTPLWDVELPPK